MKKILLIFFSTLALLFLASCGSRPELPRGVWESQYPHIILYIDPMYTHFADDSYLGIATINGEQVKVHLSKLTGSPAPHFFIVDNSTLGEGGTFIWEETVDLFYGRWRLINNQLHYATHYNGQPKTIIFNQIHDYDPIDPKYWFAHWNHIFGVWHSDSENMTIYLDTVYRSPRSRNFLGVYVLDGEEVRVMVEASRHHPNLFIRIFDASFFIEETGRFRIDTDDPFVERVRLFSSIFEVKGDEMTLRPFLDDFDEILFRRLDDYKEINPDDWFQNP